MPRNSVRRTTALALVALVALVALEAGCDDGATSPGQDAADDADSEADSGEAAVDAPDAEADVVEAAPDAPDAEADVPDVPVDTADVSDTAPDGEPPFAGVLCGFGICGASEVCCVTASPAGEECTAPTACAGDFVLTCDGSEDCAEGEQCCMPSGAILQTPCAAACASGLPMCHVVAECDDGDPGTFDYCHPSMCIYPMFERGTICVHSRNENCTNAVDDDGDTRIDADDPDCSTFPC
jgi:hypothetical protein